MSYRHWNYLRLIFLMLLQGALTAILLSAWLQLAADYWQFSAQAIFWWAFVTSVLTIFAGWKSLGMGVKGLFFLAGSVIAALALAFLWGLPLLFCLPSSLFLLLLGSRFLDYFRRSAFTLDWGLASLFLVMTALFQPRLGYDLGLNHIVAFFAAGVAALILWNTMRLEEAGLQPDYGGLGRSIPFFILGVVLLAIFLAGVLSPEILQTGINFVRFLYHTFVDLAMFLFVKPLAWLMAPLFRWAEKMAARPLTLEIPQAEGDYGEMPEFTEGGLSPQALQAISWASWLLGALFLLATVWLVYRWVLRAKREKKPALVQETRQSVFSKAEVWADLKQVLRSLLKPFSRKDKAYFYRGGDPLQQIRAFYARFVYRARKKVAYEAAATPREYYQNLAGQKANLDLGAAQELTVLYQEARYREKGDQNAVKRAEAAFRQIR